MIGIKQKLTLREFWWRGQKLVGQSQIRGLAVGAVGRDFSMDFRVDNTCWEEEFAFGDNNDEKQGNPFPVASTRDYSKQRQF